jgi:dTDP-4-amino-4,6-dideoxygalactose transaminase
MIHDSRPMLRVPFLDLEPMNSPVRAAIMAGVDALFDTSRFINGPAVADFEQAFARYCGTEHCVGMSSGLDAIRIALMAAGVERGDEVIVPANTFAATFEAVTQAGAVPVVVDVTEDDYNIDVRAAAAAIGPRTRALLPVHLYGQLADMSVLRTLATTHGLALVEDAAQAHGAERDGIRAGAGGLAAAFSFYPGKNLGALGDAGALTTNDAELATRARALREHGQLRKYEYAWEGYTARLDTIQAIALNAKLPYLDGWNVDRRTQADTYLSRLGAAGTLRLPRIAARSLHVWHLFVVRSGDPVGLAAFLEERGIATGRHYPIPPHLSQAYAYLGHRAGSFPVAEAISREGLSLPLFPGLGSARLDRVCEALLEYAARA